MNSITRCLTSNGIRLLLNTSYFPVLPKVSSQLLVKCVTSDATVATEKKNQPFGICFDIDGVLTRGYVPIEGAADAFKLLQGDDGQLNVPVAFVTNGLSKNDFKAKQLTEWLGVPVMPDQVVQAHSPLKLFKDLHAKHCLVIGQGPLRELAQEVGFTNVSLIDDVTDAYPLLDVMDHERRSKVATSEVTETEMPKIEAVVLLGEPGQWERPLQVLIDVLLTTGRPVGHLRRRSRQSVPVIACNMDLQYMHRASHPRFGHGSFLCCLEALYKKTTGLELRYEYLVGKPTELTSRFAEHCVSSHAQSLGLRDPIRTLYVIGDNREVDVVGANLYQRYLHHTYHRHHEGWPFELPAGRVVPHNEALLPQTATKVHSVLVRTGMYQGEMESSLDSRSEKIGLPTVDLQMPYDMRLSLMHSHRDFPLTEALLKPALIVDDVLAAVRSILLQERGE